VRSALIFSKDNELTKSGYGLMFLDPPGEFRKIISQYDENKKKA
jgi:hypothetical protein